MLLRRRFADLVERQLDLFAADHADLVADVESAHRAYDTAARDEAEERYGDFLDLVDAGQGAIAEVRDAYAETLEPAAAGEYRSAFNRLARKRFSWFALELED